MVMEADGSEMDSVLPDEPVKKTRLRSPQTTLSTPSQGFEWTRYTVCLFEPHSEEDAGRSQPLSFLMNGRNHHHTPHRVTPRALCRAWYRSRRLKRPAQRARTDSNRSRVSYVHSAHSSGVGLTLTETSVGRQRDVRLRNARRSVAQRKYNAIAEDPMAWCDGTP